MTAQNESRPSDPNATGGAVLRVLRTIERYERWQGRPLSPALDRWLHHEATEQELLTLGAAVLTRLIKQG